MTFYNIVFGILFVGAFREVLRSLAAGPEWTTVCLSATLAILIFSDTIYTSVVVEGRRRVYSVAMMLLDLLSFILLSLAVVTLDPTVENMFQVDVRNLLDRLYSSIGLGPETAFWMLLSLYMANLIAWNSSHDCYSNLTEHRWLGWVQPLMLALFAVMALLTHIPSVGPTVLNPLRLVVLVLTLAYLLGYKPFLIKMVHDRDLRAHHAS